MYCGNNRRHPDLRAGRKVIGNRYDCFRRGVGVGLSLPYDPSYLNRYVPIDPRKIYCGKSDRLPENYHILGSNPMCYTKGVGVGRTLKAKRQRMGKRRKSKLRFSGKSKRKSVRKSKRKSKRKSVKKSKRKS